MDQNWERLARAVLRSAARRRLQRQGRLSVGGMLGWRGEMLRVMQALSRETRLNHLPRSREEQPSSRKNDATPDDGKDTLALCLKAPPGHAAVDMVALAS